MIEGEGWYLCLGFVQRSQGKEAMNLKHKRTSSCLSSVVRQAPDGSPKPCGSLKALTPPLWQLTFLYPYACLFAIPTPTPNKTVKVA